MHKRDFFLAALKAGSFRYKRWVLEAFSVTRAERTLRYVQFPYALTRNTVGEGPANGRYSFIDPETGAIDFLDDTVPHEPAFSFRDEILLNPGDLENVRKSVVTTYGNVLFNQMVLVWPFGNKIEYMEGAITVPRVEKIIEARLTDDPPEGTAEDPDAIYVHEYKRYNDAIFNLAGYTQLCVPSASPKTMTSDPAIAVRRDELLREYADRLQDPVVQAKIDAELIAMDRAWMKGDDGEGFYIKAKSYDVVRKKTFLLQGAAQGFDVAGDVIPTSLNEGWKIENLPAMGNSLREGSYSRGALTALGGEATKFNYRIFQNTGITEDDCGSKMGLRVSLHEGNIKNYISSSILTDDLGLIELTEENLSTFKGKTVSMRSPIYCRAPGANFCAVCMGRKIASTPHAIPTYAADIGSTFMSIMLKLMHGKSLSVEKMDFKTAIT